MHVNIHDIIYMWCVNKSIYTCIIIAFFHIVAVHFTLSMAYETASNASFLCSDDTAIMTLASPTGTTLLPEIILIFLCIHSVHKGHIVGVYTCTYMYINNIQDNKQGNTTRHNDTWDNSFFSKKNELPLSRWVLCHCATQVTQVVRAQIANTCTTQYKARARCLTITCTWTPVLGINYGGY